MYKKLLNKALGVMLISIICILLSQHLGISHDVYADMVTGTADGTYDFSATLGGDDSGGTGY